MRLFARASTSWPLPIWLRRWLEKDVAELRATFAASATALTDQVVVSGLGFATSIIIGRESSVMLGVYYLALSIVLFARSVQESLVAVPYKVFSHRYEGEALGRYTGSALLQHCAVSGLGSLLLFAVALSPLARSLPAGLAPVLWLLAWALPLLLLREILRQISFARLQFPTALCLDAAVALLQLGGLLWLAEVDSLSVPRAYGVIAIACWGGCCVWYFGRRAPVTFRHPQQREHWRRNWHFGRWALAAGLVGAVAPYVVPWMLSFLWDNQATGLFAACMTLVGASRVLTDASFNVLTPKSARAFHLGGRPALLRVLRQWAAMFTVLMGLFTLATALVGEKILVVVYGPEYAGTTTPLMLLALGLAVHTLGCTCADGLFVLERTRENFWADVISTGLVLIVSVPLISNWGVTGAALTTLIAMSSGALARAAILWRCWSLHDEVGSGPGDA